MKPLFLSFFLTLIMIHPVAGEESFRATVTAEIALPLEVNAEKTAGVAMEEGLVLTLQGETRFLQTLKLELLVSNTLKQFYDSFGIAIYKSVKPYPRKGIKAFSGEKIFFHYLPFLNRIHLTIPIHKGSEEKSSLSLGNFVLEKPVRPEEFPLMVTVIPIMKGIPDTLYDAKFFFNIKPVLEKMGVLEFIVNFPTGQEPEPLEIFLDEAQATREQFPMEVSSGIHNLRIRSRSFREANVAVTVESGKTSRAEVLLERISSILTIEAPDSAEVFLNGEKIADFRTRKIPLREGEYLVRIKLGDYSVSKRFDAKEGKSYHLSCLFSITLEEK